MTGGLLRRISFLTLGVILVATVPARAHGAENVDRFTDGASAAANRAPASDGRVGIWFLQNPMDRLDTVLEGAAAERATWTRDRPAFPGDRPGSLTARYDALADPALVGFPLPAALDQNASFTAGAVFVIRSTSFVADPAGFFQISWGLWNGSRTGLERTGDLQDFSGDTFDLMEFDWFPNVTPFGGPFLSPIVFGEANTSDPLFPFLGSFSNLTFAAQEADLPLDAPLLAVLEHRPDDDALLVSVYRIVGSRRVVPVNGAVAVVPLDALPQRAYELDTLGMTLWRDGFSGPSPSLRADVVFHALLLQAGTIERPEVLLGIPPVQPRASDR